MHVHASKELADALVCMMRNNADLRKTFQVIEDFLDEHPCMDAPATERQLRRVLPHMYAPGGTFPLSFKEASALDRYFFNVGKTGFWRQAYGYPEEGTKWVSRSSGDERVAIATRAENVGIFTFNVNEIAG